MRWEPPVEAPRMQVVYGCIRKFKYKPPEEAPHFGRTHLQALPLSLLPPHPRHLNCYADNYF